MVVAESRASPAELLAKDAVDFREVLDHVLLLPIDAAGDEEDQEMETWWHVRHAINGLQAAVVPRPNSHGTRSDGQGHAREGRPSFGTGRGRPRRSGELPLPGDLADCLRIRRGSVGHGLGRDAASAASADSELPMSRHGADDHPRLTTARCRRRGCGRQGRLQVVATITQPDVIRRILDRLGIPTRPPPLCG